MIAFWSKYDLRFRIVLNLPTTVVCGAILSWNLSENLVSTDIGKYMGIVLPVEPFAVSWAPQPCIHSFCFTESHP